MKILFITSEHPNNKYGGLGAFTQNFLSTLKNYCDVVSIYFHLTTETLPTPSDLIDYSFVPNVKFESNSYETNILEVSASFREQVDSILKTFKPDIIHCNDRQTFMPFRFLKNVVYSSHLFFCDLLGLKNLNDSLYSELKVERCAFENSNTIIAYSKFAADRILKFYNKRNIIVLPLGCHYIESKRNHNKTNICYFGRFEDYQKNYTAIIKAINILGKDFKRKYNISYSFFGKGVISHNDDLSLIDNITFLQGEKLKNAYKTSDIIIMPSTYEPFGLVGLEAMSSGAILLCTKNQGMDEFANKDNCIFIEPTAFDISKKLENIVKNLEKFNYIRQNGINTAKFWTWDRAVKAHLQFYTQLIEKNLNFSYSYKDVLNLTTKINTLDLNSLNLYIKETSNIINKIFDTLISEEEKNVTITSPVINFTGIKKSEIIRIFEKNSLGIIPSCENLFVCSNKFDTTLLISASEFILDLDSTITELKRVTKKRIIIAFWKNETIPFQTIKIENFYEIKQFFEKNKINNCKKVYDENNFLIVEAVI